MNYKDIKTAKYAYGKLNLKLHLSGYIECLVAAAARAARCAAPKAVGRQPGCAAEATCETRSPRLQPNSTQLTSLSSTVCSEPLQPLAGCAVSCL